ncbi:GNAT family N-acetyltransferase [Leisingera sp. MMG026]|uniref:GNAT family N-acetyltransferase n=1 Tax=Leisingera sp. MMG026 TaxID=2909982 RepID=UPI001F1DEDD1|nr:GNAT family N-acetyltransferase [Leisingera sp. MMG026]MCF6431831.1 GNAT family N-acetyltransferase [Leisingera sp. MMG026]
MSLLDLQTSRLRAVPWRNLTDAEMAELFAPKVVQWLPSGFQTPEDDGARRAFLEAVSQQAEVIALRETAGQGIGLVIFSFPDKGAAIRNLGYLFAEAAWGQGLASELLGGLQAHFRGSGVTISGGVMQQNAASARVLEKAGFTPGPSGTETVYSWRAGG